MKNDENDHPSGQPTRNEEQEIKVRDKGIRL